MGVQIKKMSDADPHVRLEAINALAELREGALPALDALITALDDPDADVRVAAVHAIGSLPAEEAEHAMAWAMASGDYRVQVAARLLVQGTAKLRGPDSTVWRDPAIGLGE